MFYRLHRIKESSGVSLAEVIIAAAIAGISIISMMMLFPKMKILVNAANHKVEAVRYCQTKLEDLRRIGFAAVAAGTTTEVVVIDPGKNLTSAADDLRAIRTTTVTNVFNGATLIARKILVQCQWREHHAIVNEYLDLILYRNIP